MLPNIASPNVLFVNAAVFEGVSPQRLLGMSVLVADGAIKCISSEPIDIDNAEIIDCTGKTLMPGMIDNHVHIYAQGLPFTPPGPPITYRAQYAQKFLRHMLSCGFTTVRDVAGGDHGMAMALRDGFFDGPRFFYGGLALTQTGGHGDFRDVSHATDFCACCKIVNVFAIHADGVDECVKAVREELRKGAHHIKIMGSGGVLSQSDPLERCQYSEREIRAIVEECDRQGSYVCAHCLSAESIRRCVEFGVRSIEHGTLIDDETAAFVAEKGAYVIPTLAVVSSLKANGRQMGLTEASYEKLLVVHRRGLEGLTIMKRAGVKMGFGTDLIGAEHTLHGDEFTVRKQVLSAFDILNSATAINAEILGMEGKLGVIREGALADVLLVDGDPLEDIDLLATNGERISHIMVGGRFVKRSPAV